MNPLGIDKPIAQTRVVVAMSGGVDSSVVAALLHQQGYDVVGITLQLYDHGATTQRKGACCAGRDVYDARAVADRIGVPHYVLDYEDRFRSAVIDDFADAYARGETPIPCIQCNRTVKFRDLLATAKDLGGDALATGHYAQRIVGPHGAQLHAGADPDRDQSYFLFATTREQLAFLRFPLGGLSKAETRRKAAQFDLAVADKPDSQDICFTPADGYGALAARLRPDAAEPGDIVHIDGAVLGRHQGILHYTIGQRRGLGVGGRCSDADAKAAPLYVVALQPEARRVVVGPRSALAVTEIQLRDINWLGDTTAMDPTPRAMTVKIRSSMTAVTATLTADGADAATARFADPQYGVSPGQACVFYDGARVLGGGWIQRTARSFEALT